MSPDEKKEVIENIIYHRFDGDSCIETAENYVDDVREVDPELHQGMKDLLSAASDMIARLSDLAVEHDLDKKYNISEL